MQRSATRQAQRTCIEQHVRQLQPAEAGEALQPVGQTGQPLCGCVERKCGR